MRAYAIIQYYSNGVDGWEHLVTAFSDETVAGCCEIDLNERLGRGGNSFGESRSFSVRQIDLLDAYDINELVKRIAAD